MDDVPELLESYIESYCRPDLFTEETKKSNKLILSTRKEYMHMAICVSGWSQSTVSYAYIMHDIEVGELDDLLSLYFEYQAGMDSKPEKTKWQGF